MNLTVQNEQEKIISMNSPDFQNLEELDAYIGQQMSRTAEGHKCNICNKTSRKPSHMKEHIEIHINGLSFNCDRCGKTYSNRNNLRNHKIKTCIKK